MNPGELDKRIIFFRNAENGETNELGANETKEEKIYECWAKLESRTGSLLTGRAADTKLSKTTHKFTIRYTKKIPPDCWIVYDNRRFDIDYINDPDFKKEKLEIFVQEII